MQSDELFIAILESGIKVNDYWWPNYGTFEVVVGAILTQNTKWNNVENSLENLKNANLLNLEKIANCDILFLSELIKSSGFHNVKSKRLNMLCKNILKDFGDFDSFVNLVSRKWLISQKGIGFESCDAILCYACKRDIMVVDNYTKKILSKLNYEFESYDEAREWLEGMDMQIICDYYGENLSINEIYARFHGAIVEFCKLHLKGNKFSKQADEILAKFIDF